MTGYKHILRGDVPGWVLQVAEKAVHDAAVDLGIRIPTIRWWNADPGFHKAGWFDVDIPGEINLVGNRMHDAYSTRARCFHECRHAWQWQEARYIGDVKAAEDDANGWARRATGYDCDLLQSWEL